MREAGTAALALPASVLALIGAVPGTTPVAAPSAAAPALVGAAAATMPPPASSAAVPAPARSSNRPNIVLVLTDDMRSDDLRFAPHVRRLIAQRGVEFRNSFAPYPLCAPSRASLLTGQYAHNHGVLHVDRPFGFGSFDDSHTLATALLRSGYRTALVGKYMNGYGTQPSLVDGTRWQYVPRGWSRWFAGLQHSPSSPAQGGLTHYYETPYEVDGEVDNSHDGEYQTVTLGQRARQLVRRFSGRRPFFIDVAFVAPHDGRPREKGDPGQQVQRDGHKYRLSTPARPRRLWGVVDGLVRRAPGVSRAGTTEKNINDKQRRCRAPELTRAERSAVRELTRQRGEAIRSVDHQVALLVDQLRAVGELDETIIVFTSDNGFFLGEHRHRQGKLKAYAPSLRVPLLAAGPGLPRGVDRFDPATTMDVAATIADWAGAADELAREVVVDGRSLVPALSRGDRGWKSPVVTEAVLGRPRDRAANPKAGFDDARRVIGIRTARFLYLRYADKWEELYDLDRDANELRSVIDRPAYAHRLRMLRRVWWDAKDCAGASCRSPLPPRLQRGPRALATRTRAQLHQLSDRSGSRW